MILEPVSRRLRYYQAPEVDMLPGAVALALAFANPGVAEAATAECRIEDLTPSFWSFWDEARDKAPAEQVRLFEEVVQKPNSAVYAGILARVPMPLDELVPRSIERSRPVEGAMRTVSAQLKGELPAQLALSRREFPDFQCSTPVYFVYSAGAFDGATRQVGGQTALLFGIDVIASLGEALPPLVVHELFHVHHARLAPDAPDLFYWAMWREGLATYVSRRLNPDLPEEKACCMPAVPETVAVLPKIVPEALSLLDSGKQEEYARYFLGGAQGDIPRRSGYYLGYLVAQDLGRSHSLRELAALSPAEVRPLLEAALRARAPRASPVGASEPAASLPAAPSRYRPGR